MIPDLVQVSKIIQVTAMLHNISILFGDSMEELDSSMFDNPGSFDEQQNSEAEPTDTDDEIEIRMPRIMTRTFILERFHP